MREKILSNPPVLSGLRRELTREKFEELSALQCEKEEILGWAGITAEQLERWCRKIYRRGADEMLGMIRMDGLIAIRRASFEQLRKSAALVGQQYNRFLPESGAAGKAGTEAAVKTFIALTSPSSEEMEGACS